MSLYLVNTESENLNSLGEYGWEVINLNPFIIAYQFDINQDSTILQQFVQWFSVQATKSKQARDYLTSRGFEFDHIYGDNEDKWECRRDCPRLLQWRVEINRSETPTVLCLTFGDLDMNIPNFCDKEVIDKYCPKAIIDQAIEAGVLTIKDTIANA